MPNIKKLFALLKRLELSGKRKWCAPIANVSTQRLMLGRNIAVPAFRRWKLKESTFFVANCGFLQISNQLHVLRMMRFVVLCSFFITFPFSHLCRIALREYEKLSRNV